MYIDLNVHAHVDQDEVANNLFFFLVFKENLEYIWFSTSFFDLNAYFMWIFPCGTSEKIWRISEIFKKKVPKFLNFVGTEKFSFFSVILKLALLFDFCFGFNALQCLRYWRKFFKCLRIWIFCEGLRIFAFWNRNLFLT